MWGVIPVKIVFVKGLRNMDTGMENNSIENTVKTIHISDTLNSTVDLGYYDNDSQSTTLFLTITKGII